MSTSAIETKKLQEIKGMLTPEKPWLGLRPFPTSARNYFFGRRAETTELSDRVVHRRLTVLFGKSGLGKTSLLQAGVIPHLHKQGLETVYIRLHLDENAPDLELQVLEALLSTLGIADPSEQSECHGLWELFHDPELGLIRNESGDPRNIVLIFDQFEELYTLGETKRPQDVKRFMNILAALVENRPTRAIAKRMEEDEAFAERMILASSPVKFLIALREDYIHWLERYRTIMPSMMDNRFELLPLRGTEAMEVVCKAACKRCEKKPNLPPIVSKPTAEAIVRYVAGAKKDRPVSELSVVPPLLNLVCEQLNRNRLSQSRPTIEVDDVDKSASQVLVSFYENCFADLPEFARSFVEDELLSESGFRESLTLDGAVAALRGEGIVEAEEVWAHLIDARLIAVDDRGGVPRIELAHDILTPIVKASRSAREERKSQELVRDDYVRSFKRWTWTALFLLSVGSAIGLSLLAFYSWQQRNIAIAETSLAKEASQEAEKAKRLAEEQRRIAEEHAAAAKKAEEDAKKVRDFAEEKRTAAEFAYKEKLNAEGELRKVNEKLEKQNSDIRQAEGEAKRLLTNASQTSLHLGAEKYGELLYGDRSSVYVGKSKWNEAMAFWTLSLQQNKENSAARGAILAGLNELPELSNFKDSFSDWGIPEVTDLLLAPDGKSVLTTSETSLRLFLAKANHQLQYNNQRIVEATFSQSGKLVVVRFESGHVGMFDVQTGKSQIFPTTIGNEKLVSACIEESKQVLITVRSSGANVGKVRLDYYGGQANSAQGMDVPKLNYWEPIRQDSLSAGGFFVFFEKHGTWGVYTLGFDGKLVNEVSLGEFRQAGHVYSNSQSKFAVLVENDPGNKYFKTSLIDLVNRTTTKSDYRMPSGEASGKLSPHGRYIVAMDVSACGGDSYLQLWDILQFQRQQTSYVPRSLRTSADNEKKLIFGRSDDSLLFVVSDQNTIEKWDSLDASLLTSYHSASPVMQIAYDQAADRLIALCEDRKIRQWSMRPERSSLNGVAHGLVSQSVLQTPETNPQHTVNLASPPMRVWVDQQSQKIEISSSDRQVSFDLNLQNGTKTSKIPSLDSSRTHKHASLYLELSRDSSSSTIVQIKAKQTDQQNWRKTLGGFLTVADESSDGRFVLLDGNSQLELWDIVARQRVGGPWKIRNQTIHASLSPDGKQVVVTHGRRASCTFNAESKRDLTLFEAGSSVRNFSIKGEIASAKFSDDSRYLLVVGRDQTCWLADPRTGLPCSDSLKLVEEIKDAVYHDGRLYVVGPTKLYLWNPQKFDAGTLNPDDSTKEVETWLQYIAGLRIDSQGVFVEIDKVAREKYLKQVSNLPEPWNSLHNRIYANDQRH